MILISTDEFEDEIIRIWTNHVSLMGPHLSDYDAGMSFHSYLVSGYLGFNYDQYIIPFCEILKNGGFNYFQSYICGQLDEFAIIDILNGYKKKYGYRTKIIDMIKDVLDTIKNDDSCLNTILNNLSVDFSSDTRWIDDSVDDDVFYLRDRADNGDAECQFIMSNMYLQGRGIPVDLDKSKAYLDMAVKSGLQEALIEKASRLESESSSDSKAEGIKLYIKAIRSGRTDLVMHVASMIDKDAVSRIPPADIKFILRSAADTGSSEFQYRYAEFLNRYSEKYNLTDAAKKAYITAADNGNISAMYRLGLYYELNPEPVLDSATQWYLRAIANENADAMYRLAEMIFNNQISTFAFEQAIELYERASELGCESAKIKLGRIYYAGIGVDKDLHHSIELLQSADSGDDCVNLYLGLSYFDDGQVESGAECLQKYTDQDDIRVISRLSTYELISCKEFTEFKNAFTDNIEIIRNPDIEGCVLKTIIDCVNDRCGNIRQNVLASSYESMVRDGYVLIFAESGEAAIMSYQGNEKILDVPSQVEKDGNVYSISSIADDAFILNHEVYAVTLHHGIRFIGMNSFYGCTNLIALCLPDTILSIGEGAFSGCTMLANVELPDHASLENSVFDGCKNLKSAVLPKNSVTIPDCTFYDCSELSEVKTPVMLKQIGIEAFHGCLKLKGKKIISDELGIVDLDGLIC